MAVDQLFDADNSKVIVHRSAHTDTPTSIYQSMYTYVMLSGIYCIQAHVTFMCLAAAATHPHSPGFSSCTAIKQIKNKIEW